MGKLGFIGVALLAILAYYLGPFAYRYYSHPKGDMFTLIQGVSSFTRFSPHFPLRSYFLILIFTFNVFFCQLSWAISLFASIP